MANHGTAVAGQLCEEVPPQVSLCPCSSLVQDRGLAERQQGSWPRRCEDVLQERRAAAWGPHDHDQQHGPAA